MLDLISDKTKLHNMKGVSPIIAIVLVVGFTVAVGATVSMWGTGLLSSQTETIAEQFEERVDCSGPILQLQKVTCNEDGSLLGLWHFEENDGNVARDSSPAGRTINLTSPIWTEGRSGRGLQFDGSNYGVISGSESLTPEKFTIEAWVYKP
jgi:flagellin-like protein